MSEEVAELRKGVRFNAVQPIPGTFGAAEVMVANVATGGAQIVHAQPLRIGTRARLAFRAADAVVSVVGVVVWSRLSRTEAGGALAYSSGVKIEAPDAPYAAASNAMYVRGVIQKDASSLERKRERMIEREKQRASQTKLRAVPMSEPPPS